MIISELRLKLPIAVLAGLLGAAGWLPAAVAGTEFKIATVAPEGSDWMRQLRAAGAEVAERTEGRVRLRFYGGGVQGNDRRVIRKIRIGQLHGGLFTASGLAERYPDINIYGLPGLFESLDEVEYVRARMDPIFEAGLERAGFVSFGFAGGGFAYFMGRSPITTLQDLRGRKIWVPEGDRVSYEAMARLRLSPVVLSITDVLTGLQTDLIDVVVTPPVGAVVLQWYTRVRYVTELPISYTMGVMAIDQREFRRLTPADQAIFRDVMTDLYRRLDAQGRDDNIAASRALEANGLRFVRPDQTQRAEWLRTAAAVNRELAEEGLFSVELLEQVFEHLEDLRVGEAPAAGQHGSDRGADGQRPGT